LVSLSSSLNRVLDRNYFPFKITKHAFDGCDTSKGFFSIIHKSPPINSLLALRESSWEDSIGDLLDSVKTLKTSDLNRLFNKGNFFNMLNYDDDNSQVDLVDVLD